MNYLTIRGLTNKKAGGLCEPPAVRIVCLFVRGFHLLHLLLDLRLDGIEIEAHAFLHQREPYQITCSIAKKLV